MSYIGATQGTSSPVLLDSITVVNNQAAYTMQKDGVNYTPASTLVMQVSLNGIIQQPGGGSYTINGSTITFASALVTGDVIDYILVREPTTGTIAPIDGSITDSKIVSMAASKLTGALPALDGSALTGVSAGKVLQVKQTSINSEVSASPSGNATFADISGMSVSITPASTSNKILVSYSVNIGRSVTSQNNSVRLVRDSTPIVGTGASTANITTFHRMDTAQLDNGGIIYLDSPATTSAVTYKLQWASESGGTIYLNRRGSSAGFVGVSTITVMEIES